MDRSKFRMKAVHHTHKLAPVSKKTGFVYCVRCGIVIAYNELSCKVWSKPCGDFED